MCCTTNRLLIALLIMLPGILPAIAANVDQPDQEDPVFEIISNGYSRFEFSNSDVVAFYTEGVEFRYLNITVTADNLRYNHATLEAIVDGVVTGSFEDSTFTCGDLYLSGLDGVMEMPNGCVVENEKTGTKLVSGHIRCIFPAGSTSVELTDMLIEASEGVSIETQEGDVIQSPGLIFAGDTMTASTTGGASLVMAEQVISSGNADALDLSGMRIDAQSIVCKLDESTYLKEIKISNVNGVSDPLIFSGNALHAVPVSATPGKGEGWDVTATELLGELQLADSWMRFAAGEANTSLAGPAMSEFILQSSVEVVSNSGSFKTERATAVLTEHGYQFVLPDDVVISFDLAAITGQDPVGINVLGAAQDE